MTSNPRSDPVINGTVRPDGAVFRSTVAQASDIFWRQLHAQEFDVSEMSLSSLLITIAKGNRDWIGLPMVRSNRKTLETLAQYSFEQGLTPRKIELDEVFAPSTLDL